MPDSSTVTAGEVFANVALLATADQAQTVEVPDAAGFVDFFAKTLNPGKSYEEVAAEIEDLRDEGLDAIDQWAWQLKSQWELVADLGVHVMKHAGRHGGKLPDLTRDPPTVTRKFANTEPAVDTDHRYAMLVASTSALDADGEVLYPGEFELARFKANPVILAGHKSGELPVGSARDRDGSLHLWVNRDELRVGCFFSRANKAADTVYSMCREGLLKGVSVGIRSKGTRPPTSEEIRKYGTSNFRVHKPGAELLEVSLVSVPSNPTALVSAVKGLTRKILLSGVS